MRTRLFYSMVLVMMASAACVHVGPEANDGGPNGDGSTRVDAGPPLCPAGEVPPLEGADGGADAGTTGPTGGIGDRGFLAFYYDSGEALVSYPWRPLLVGTQETVVASRQHLLPNLTADVTDTSIASVVESHVTDVCCEMTDAGDMCADPMRLPSGCAACTADPARVTATAYAAVHALAVGDTHLELRTADGAVFETIAIAVRAAASLRVEQLTFGGGHMPVDRLTLPQGESFRLQASVFGADNQQLEARFGVSARSDTPSVFQVSEHTFLGTFSDHVDSFDIDVRGVAAGTGTLSFTAGSAHVEIPITVQ